MGGEPRRGEDNGSESHVTHRARRPSFGEVRQLATGKQRRGRHDRPEQVPALVWCDTEQRQAADKQAKEETLKTSFVNGWSGTPQNSPHRRVSKETPRRGSSEIVKRREVELGSGQLLLLTLNNVKHELPHEQFINNAPPQL